MLGLYYGPSSLLMILPHLHVSVGAWNKSHQHYLASPGLPTGVRKMAKGMAAKEELEYEVEFSPKRVFGHTTTWILEIESKSQSIYPITKCSGAYNIPQSHP